MFSAHPLQMDIMPGQSAIRAHQITLQLSLKINDENTVHHSLKVPFSSNYLLAYPDVPGDNISDL